MSNNDLPTSDLPRSDTSTDQTAMSPSPPPSTTAPESESMSQWTRLSLLQARRMTEMAEAMFGRRESPAEWAEDVSNEERRPEHTSNQAHNQQNPRHTSTNQENPSTQECIVVSASSKAATTTTGMEPTLSISIGNTQQTGGSTDGNPRPPQSYQPRPLRNSQSILNRRRPTSSVRQRRTPQTTPRTRTAVDHRYQRVTETHLQTIQPWLWTDDQGQQLVAPIPVLACLQDQGATTEGGPSTPPSEGWLGQSIPNSQPSATPIDRNTTPVTPTTPGTSQDPNGKRQVKESEALRDESPSSSVRTITNKLQTSGSSRRTKTPRPVQGGGNPTLQRENRSEAHKHLEKMIREARDLEEECNRVLRICETNRKNRRAPWNWVFFWIIHLMINVLPYFRGKPLNVPFAGEIPVIKTWVVREMLNIDQTTQAYVQKLIRFGAIFMIIELLAELPKARALDFATLPTEQLVSITEGLTTQVALLVAGGVLASLAAARALMVRPHFARDRHLSMPEANEIRANVASLTTLGEELSAAVTLRTSQLRQANERHNNTIELYNHMVERANLSTEEAEQSEKKFIKAREEIEGHVKAIEDLEGKLKDVNEQLTQAQEKIANIEGLMIITTDQKAERIKEMQGKIDALNKEKFELNSTAAIQAAQASFELARGTLAVIKEILERNNTRIGPNESSTKTIGAMPRKFDGTDVKKFTLWTFEIRNYVGNQLSAFKDCQAIKLVFLSSLTGTASAYANRFMPEMFSEDDKTEEAKKKALNDMIDFLAGRYTDFIAQQRARETLDNYSQKESEEFQTWYLVYDELTHEAGYIHENYGNPQDFEHLHSRIRTGLRNNHDIKKIRMQNNRTIQQLVHACAQWDSQTPRSGGGRIAGETPTQDPPKADKTNRWNRKKAKETTPTTSQTPSPTGNIKRLSEEERNKMIKDKAGKKCPRGTECRFGDTCWYGTH
ncbi:hypothetical protein BDD12DRAFT_903792 [Trichophaea hybrida]|nr:hypothetical protein BDD12DRAFT_903792 [Trichophaea hybrida]